MKKTFTINISGAIFHIEEDAYELLQNYLSKLKLHFGNGDEGREIIADIESRIAELFLEKSKDEKKVVESGWVEEVIKTMGTPEDFNEEQEEETPLTDAPRTKRRLYRDTESRIIGGVCGGLGAYFNMDPVILRIIMAILFFINGIGFLAYLILWIAVPKAKTTAQRLEMRGQEVNVSNIQKTIREEVQDVKAGFQKVKNSETVTRGKENVARAGEAVNDLFRVTFRAFVVVLGVLLIIAGFFGLVGFISSLVIGQSLFSVSPLFWDADIQLPSLLGHFVSPTTVALGGAAIFFLVGIPLLALLFIGTKLVFNYKSNNTMIGLGMVGIWLIALVTLGVVSAGQAANFRNRSALTQTENIDCKTCKTIYLEAAPDKYREHQQLDWDLDQFRVVEDDGKTLLLGVPRLNIEKSGTDEFSLQIRKRARGKDQADANNTIQEVSYRFEVRDSTLVIDPWYFLGSDSKWRDQRVELTLKVPEGKAVFLNENLKEMVYNIENVSNTWDRDMVGKLWEMKPGGLTQIK